MKMWFNSLGMLAIAGSVALSPLNITHLVKRGSSGDMTYYTPEGAAGACGNHHSSSDFIVALNHVQFGNHANSPTDMSPWCGTCILLKANGKSLVVQIQDKCPGCNHGDVDVTPRVFDHFAHQDLGRIKVSWEPTSCHSLGKSGHHGIVPTPWTPPVHLPPKTPTPAEWGHGTTTPPPKTGGHSSKWNPWAPSKLAHGFTKPSIIPVTTTKPPSFYPSHQKQPQSICRLNHPYFVITTSISYQQAREACRANQGHLADIGLQDYQAIQQSLSNCIGSLNQKFILIQSYNGNANQNGCTGVEVYPSGHFSVSQRACSANSVYPVLCKAGNV